jgi:2-hydroxychromene-2-carboxylate isomerase
VSRPLGENPVAPAAAFYFDLASPLAYLAAERVLHVLPGPAEWVPVLATRLPLPSALGSGTRAPDAAATQREPDDLRARVERGALAQGLQPLVWPARFPFDSAAAMRVATYAKSIGRTVAFAQAAFRQAFAAGHALDDFDSVLISAADCEMRPRAVVQGAALRSVREALNRATAAAARAGVSDVPAMRVGERVWLGEHAVEDAAAHMREAR